MLGGRSQPLRPIQLVRIYRLPARRPIKRAGHPQDLWSYAMRTLMFPRANSDCLDEFADHVSDHEGG